MAELQVSTRQMSPRYVPLDGLRGIAALSVAFSHYISAFQLAMLTGTPAISHFNDDVLMAKTGLVIFYSPDFAVAIFFILSGFVLAASMESNRASWLALIARRWVRLMLPVLAVAVFVWVLLKLGAYAGIQKAAAQTQSAWLKNIDPSSLASTKLWKVISHNLIGPFVPHPFGALALHMNAALWTMPTELIGSLVLLSVYCFGKRVGLVRENRLVWPCLSLIIAVLTFQTKFYGFGLGVLIFEIKNLIAMKFQNAKSIFKRASLIGGVVLFGSGLWLGSTPYWVTPHSSYMCFANFLESCVGWISCFGLSETVIQMHHLGAAFVVVSSLMLPPLRWLLQTRPCQFLGRISFLFYLLQIPVLSTMAVGVFLTCPTSWGYEARAVVAFFCYLFATGLAATIAERVIDRPSILLSRRLTRNSKPVLLGDLWGRASSQVR